jgi:hypothetical protein
MGYGPLSHFRKCQTRLVTKKKFTKIDTGAADGNVSSGLNEDIVNQNTLCKKV